MLPGGAVAAAFLVSLVPGWWFLRRTESARRPRHPTAWQEVLELLGVGVLTTGLAVGICLFVWPDLLLDRRWPLATGRDVRTLVALSIGILASAVGLAELAAWLVRRRNPAPSAELSIGTWWSVLRPDLVPDGQLPYVAVERADGMLVEGVLHNYTWSPDATHRDIALKKPIKFTEPPLRKWWRRESRSVSRPVPFEYVIVPGSEVRHIALMYPKS